MPGVTPDSWIDHLYAQDMVNLGERGFVLARIGGSNADPQEVYPAGPWSDHTSAIAFTGDAWGTWNTLAAEAALVPDEASIGEPYVSDDIGSYLGPPPTQSGADPPDLYDRWVQLGTFQPILRLHSNNENRLPWQYPQPVQGITESFLRLREASASLHLHPGGRGQSDRVCRWPVPSTSTTPTSRPPTKPDRVPLRARHAGGSGDHARRRGCRPRCGSPRGGGSTTSPAPRSLGRPSATLAVPLDRMPVFVRQGGIIPEQSSTGGTGSPRSLTALVYPGSPGVLRPLRRCRNGPRLHQGPVHRDAHHHVIERACRRTAVRPGHDRCRSG